MGIFEKIFGGDAEALALENNILKNQLDSNVSHAHDVRAYFDSYNGFSYLYDGEKTPNELGTPTPIDVDYYGTRLRALDAYIKSPIIQTAIEKYCLWVVGAGLKFQAEPNEKYLKTRGINIDKDKFAENAEAFFRLYADSKNSSHSKQANLHFLGADGLKNLIMAGDCLIVERFKDYQPTTEVYDGVVVQDPDQAEIEKAEKRGNTVTQGVERNNNLEHIAFFLKNDDGSSTRIKARASNGILQAWLMYEKKAKITDARGMSLLASVLELDGKLDRYRESQVAGAEMNSKFPFTIEHNPHSTGANPFVDNIVSGLGTPGVNRNETNTNGDQYANKIAQHTGVQTLNLEVGSTLKKLSSNSDPDYEKFHTPNAQLIFTTIGIPPEVALALYNGSYSSSRAANKSWEFTVQVKRRVVMTNYFYKPIYIYAFTVNALLGNIDAERYLQALREKDWLVMEAYTQCRFIGKSIPHIDPVKEAKALRELLGPEFDNVPLITGEQATESTDAGDFIEVQQQAERELSKTIFIVKEEVVPVEPKPTTEKK